MCGFAGLVRPAGTPTWDPDEALRGMVAALDHRGPDDKGTWCDAGAGVYLGFRRLSILDLSEAGHQPMASASGRFVITFNGEVYNFKEMRAELSAAGATFRSGSDTEVLLAAFEHWGVERAVTRFRGMFAFALWDAGERRLWLARDRMGIKPLYLLESGGGIAFASEARSFHSCPLFDGRGDPAAAAAFLQHLYVPGRASILRGVERVPPGTLIGYGVGDGGPECVHRSLFSDLGEVRARSARSLIADPDEAVAGLHELLRESVRMRMVADVPVGAFLSGGIDSSLVVALMRELGTGPVKTFTISFDDPDFDEGPIAATVAEALGTTHTSIAFPTHEVLDLVPSLPAMSDEPMANPSLLPTMLVSRVARRDVVVALSGDGGDELFGGYNRYLHGGRLIRQSGRLPGPVRRGVGTLLSTRAGMSLAGAAFGALRPSSAGRQQSASERIGKMARLLRAGSDAEAYATLLRVGWDRPPLTGSRGPASRPPSMHRGDLEADMMFSDQGGYLPDDLLTKVDRASMFESLEARVPILDQEVVAYSWRLPTAVKMRDGITKWPLRRILESYLDPALLERPKMGFTVPIVKWLGADLREWARDTLSPSRAGFLDIWDRPVLEGAWKAFEGGRSELALPLWTATVLQSWSDAWEVDFG